MGGAKHDLIVLFMIMAGEAYYANARVEYYVTTAAVNSAALMETPFLKTVISEEKVPTDPAKMDILPYRYIFQGDTKKIEDAASTELQDKVDAMEPLIFSGMKVERLSSKVDAHMSPLISHVEAECTFDVPLPFRMIFSEERVKFSYYVHVTASAGDPAEFLRNVSTVEDFLTRSDKFTKFCGKITDLWGKLGKLMG